MQPTKIEWANFTSNPIKGLCPMDCKDNQGKPYCYARALYKRFKWNPEIRFDWSVANDVAKVRDGSRIFWGSTIELFGDWIDPAWLRLILDYIRDYAKNQTHIFLTKQPQNLIQWSPYPKNCWIGFTATNPDMFNKGLRYISEIKASVKFVSLEPLLDWNSFIGYNAWELLSWVIIGQKTPVRKTTMPKLEWVEKIVKDCDKCKTPVFLKNNLNSCAISDYPVLLDSKGNLKQEMPQ